MKKLEYKFSGYERVYEVEYDDCYEAIWNMFSEDYLFDLSLTKEQESELKKSFMEFCRDYNFEESFHEELLEYFEDDAYEYFDEQDEMKEFQRYIP